MNTYPTPTETQAAPYSTVSQSYAPPQRNMRAVVVQKILTSIFKRELPAESRLVIQRLAELFDISPTPIRESLVELESIGVIEIRPNKGAIIKPFGRRELNEMYQLRRILEVEAVRCAAPHLEKKELQNLETAIKVLLEQPQSEQWAAQLVQEDRNFHSLLAEKSDSNRLQNELARYGNLMQCLRDIVDWNRSAQELAARQHLQIIGALLQNDVSAAAQAMEEHIQSTARIIGDVVFDDEADILIAEE